MAQHTELGKTGEELAVRYLSAQGYEILHRNWRCRRSEIDIIALYKGCLHFIEVKLRSSDVFGRPEKSVHARKIGFLLRGAEAFLVQYPHYKDFRIDVLSIRLYKDRPPEFFLIEDVYK
jgi:putative endonuclease